MYRTCSVLFVVLLSWEVAAEPAVTLPWEEFRDLYSAEVRRRLAQEESKEETPGVVALERADLQLKVGMDGARGVLTVQGRHLTGALQPLQLMPATLAVTAVDPIEGALLAHCGREYCLHLTAPGGFLLSLHLAVPLERSEHERLLHLELPRAVTRSLTLELADGLELVEQPGLSDEDGRYYLGDDARVTLRLREPSADPSVQAPVVDGFTRIQVQGEGLLVTSWFLPRRPLGTELAIDLGSGTRLTGSNLPAGSLRATGEGRVLVSLERDRQVPFELRYQLGPRKGGGQSAETSLRLPRIQDNLGREGGFQLVQPEDGWLHLRAAPLVGPVPPERLDVALRTAAEVEDPYFRTTGDLHLILDRYQAVSTPELVLDTLHLYTSYAENGRALSVLRLTLPPRAGDRLALQAVPEAEIWHLKVNGRPRRLYRESSGDRETGPDDAGIARKRQADDGEGGAETWVVPLDRGQESQVELAYLHQGPRLGLQGRLELVLPATGITAGQLHVAIGLAERVRLVALEGDLVPVHTDSWPRVEGIDGALHHFVLPFYRGDALTAAIHYQEPVD